MKKLGILSCLLIVGITHAGDNRKARIQQLLDKEQQHLQELRGLAQRAPTPSMKRLVDLQIAQSERFIGDYKRQLGQ